MLSTSTLVGLACLIANNPETRSLENRLTGSERATLEIVVVQREACLPQNMENLIRETQEKINAGTMIDAASREMPTNGCF